MLSISVVDALRQAQASGEIIEVIYWGGSQPGRRRRIQPRKVSSEKVDALCLATDTVKSFFVHQIELASEVDRAHKDFDAEHGQVLRVAAARLDAMLPSDILTLVEGALAELPISPRLVQVAENAVGVFRTFKSGKIYKRPDAFIQYIPDHHQKPWHVDSTGLQQAAAYSHAHKAVQLFLSQVKSLPEKP